MPNAREALSTKLQTSPAARVRFVNSFLELLKDQGVNIDDSAAIKDLGLHLDLTDGKKWFDGSVASTNIITINH